MSVLATDTAGADHTRTITHRLLAGAAVDSFGTGVGAVAAILYFVNVRGFSAGSVATAISLGAVLGIVSPTPFGKLSDRYGLTRIYVGLLIGRGALYLVYPLAGRYPLFVVLTFAILGLEPTTPPLQQMLVGRLFDTDGRSKVMSMVVAARNAALGGGTLVAGAALATKSNSVVAVLLSANGLTFLVLAVVVHSLRHETTGRTARGPDPQPAAVDQPVKRDLPVLRNRAFLALCGTNGLLLLHDSVLFVLLPLWTVNHLGISPIWLAVLLATNTALTVLLQMAFSRMQLARASRRMLTVSAACLCAACGFGLVIDSTHQVGRDIVLCFFLVILLTVGENLHSTVAWNVTFALAPTGRRGEYLSAFNSGYAVQRVIGPVVMTVVVLGLAGGGWLILAAVFALAAFVFWRLARQLGIDKG